VSNLLRVTFLELGRSQNVVDVVHHFTVEHHGTVLLVALTTHTHTHAQQTS